MVRFLFLLIFIGWACNSQSQQLHQQSIVCQEAFVLPDSVVHRAMAGYHHADSLRLLKIVDFFKHDYATMFKEKQLSPSLEHCVPIGKLNYSQMLKTVFQQEEDVPIVIDWMWMRKHNAKKDCYWVTFHQCSEDVRSDLTGWIGMLCIFYTDEPSFQCITFQTNDQVEEEGLFNEHDVYIP